MVNGSNDSAVRNLHIAMSKFGGDCNQLSRAGRFHLVDVWDSGRRHPFYALEDSSGVSFYVYTDFAGE